MHYSSCILQPEGEFKVLHSDLKNNSNQRGYPLSQGLTSQHKEQNLETAMRKKVKARPAEGSREHCRGQAGAWSDRKSIIWK